MTQEVLRTLLIASVVFVVGFLLSRSCDDGRDPIQEKIDLLEERLAASQERIDSLDFAITLRDDSLLALRFEQERLNERLDGLRTNIVLQDRDIANLRRNLFRDDIPPDSLHLELNRILQRVLRQRLEGPGAR